MFNWPPADFVTPPFDSLNATILYSSSSFVVIEVVVVVVLFWFCSFMLELLLAFVLVNPNINSESPNFPSLASFPSLAKHSVATHNLSFFLLCLCFKIAPDKSTFETMSAVHNIKSWLITRSSSTNRNASPTVSIFAGPCRSRIFASSGVPSILLRFPRCFSIFWTWSFVHSINISFAWFWVRNSSVRSSSAALASGSKQFGCVDFEAEEMGLKQSRDDDA